MPACYSTEDFEKAFTYPGHDLGAVWLPEETAFRLWAPTAQAVTLRLYSCGDPADPERPRELPMRPDAFGTWLLYVPGNLNGVYYTFHVLVDGLWREAADPYARSAGINGHRSMVLDLSSTNPPGWSTDRSPHPGMPITDAVLYELHIRDLSTDRSVPFRCRGKFLALTEGGLTTPGGQRAGIDHICSLGVTHIQLMPIFDYCTVDEAKPGYNWGYDPANYNVPEGSYATDPRNGAVRVRELKQTIQYLHSRGLGVVMDVVFNHVYSRENFCLNRIVPGYFSRLSPEGVYSDGSGCGNDTASERSMVRKYIVDSLTYWAEEYHIDGFRFDLAGLLDAATIREAMNSLLEKRPDLLFYGEGWDMPTHPTKPDVSLAIQANSGLLPGFGFFNDTLRDLIRGSTFEATTPGYACGHPVPTESLDAVFLGQPSWAQQPAQCINYISCHDNHTLIDRLAIGAPDATREELVQRNRLAAAFSILAQGVPFFQAGEEFLRSKPGPRRGSYISNSYRSPDRINALKWAQLDEPAPAATVEFYRSLIALRKAHPALRLASREEVSRRVQPLAAAPEIAAYRVDDTAAELLILFHPGKAPAHFPLPEGGPWEILLQSDHTGNRPLGQVSGVYTLPPVTAAVLSRRKMVDVVAALIWEKDRFLICQRPAHKARGLLWEFVGGKVEPGEGFADALVRECREELGITVAVGDKFMEVIHDYPDILIRLTLFHCVIPQGRPQLLEHNALCWIHPGEIDRYSFCPADADILARLKALYGTRPPL